jgi:putrescine aminotransferase
MPIKSDPINNLAKVTEELKDVQSALRMEFSETTKLHSAYLNPFLVWISRFLGFNQSFVRASGCYLYDQNGHRYLDFLAGFSSLNLGHEPEEILEALRQVEGRPNFLQSSLNPLAGSLAEHLARLTSDELSRVFFCNSGTEACEAAIKMARVATGKTLLVYAEGAFHGKTLGSLSVSGRKKYKVPFQPLVPDTVSIPYDDESALEAVLKQGNVAAFIVEPIQGEAGVMIPEEGYLKAIRQLCDRFGALLIFDEVQSGMGRTGHFFCCEHEGVLPDILTLSKSLGGGVMPIGATLAKDQIWRKAYGTIEKCLLHTSTFGGNTRACAAGVAAIRTLISKNLMQNADEMGAMLLSRLKDFQGRYGILKSVRGKGLMIGLTVARLKGKKSLAEGAIALWMARRLLVRHRIITAFTLNNYDVLRISPPLLINQEQVDYFTEAFEDVLKAAEKFNFFRLVK